MTDGHLAHEIVQDLTIENLRDEAHAFVLAELAAIAGNDARAFLPAMLQRVEAVVRKFRRIRMTINAEHAAVMFGVILHRNN